MGFLIVPENWEVEEKQEDIPSGHWDVARCWQPCTRSAFPWELHMCVSVLCMHMGMCRVCTYVVLCVHMYKCANGQCQGPAFLPAKGCHAALL